MVLKSDEVRTQVARENVFFINKMKRKRNKNYLKGEKQAGRLGTTTWVAITHTNI